MNTIISSTARDLPEHRKQVIDACHRCTCNYVWMATLPATDDDAVKASMALVEKADVYIGVFAHRDDKQKKHPCLVPYDQLPETEKEYDRKTAEATLKAIMKLGFTIQ